MQLRSFIVVSKDFCITFSISEVVCMYPKKDLRAIHQIDIHRSPVDVVLQTHPEWIEKLTYVSISQIMGSHFSDFYDLQGLFIEEIYYVWMHWIIKMAFLLFYLRFATKLFRSLVYCTIGLNTLFTIIQWFIYCLQCIPLDTFFHPEAHPNVKCFDNSILAFVPAALVSSRADILAMYS